VSKKRSKATSGKPLWPFYEGWISQDWQEPDEITQILVARRAGSGQLAYAIFLIDLGCLGVKNADAGVIDSVLEYEQDLREVIFTSQPLEPCSLDLAAKVVHEAIAYARRLGFTPHKDTRKALKLIQDARPDRADDPVPLGDGTGKPFYVAGPYDNSAWVLAKLDRTVGPGNYAYLVPTIEEP
jgi:hypothetical protein